MEQVLSGFSHFFYNMTVKLNGILVWVSVSCSVSLCFLLMVTSHTLSAADRQLPPSPTPWRWDVILNGVEMESTVIRNSSFVRMSVSCCFILSMSVHSPCWILSTGITSWRWAFMAVFSAALLLMSRERRVMHLKDQNVNYVSQFQSSM